MAEKRYYWLKLQDGFFDSKQIRKLRREPDGDACTIIYLKMQLLAMKHEGALEHSGLEESFAEELALELGEDADRVRATVDYLLRCGLLETADGKEYFVPCAVENTGSEASSTRRVREYRSRKALQSAENETPSKRGSNTEEETERKTEQEAEKEAEESLERIAALYNELCPSFPRLRSLSSPRKGALRERLQHYSEADFRTLFEKAEQSDFLRGRNDRRWSASFDWLIQDGNMAKVLEGKYDRDKGENAHGISAGESAGKRLGNYV